MENFRNFVESCFPEAVHIKADSSWNESCIYPLKIEKDGHYVLLPYDQVNVILGSFNFMIVSCLVRILKEAERESSHDD